MIDLETDVAAEHRFGYGNRLGSTLNLDGVVKWLSVRMQECTEHHEACRSISKVTERPGHLLDLEPKTGSREDMFMLVDGASLTSPYMTLSHCWGGILPIRTTTANIERFRLGCLINELPLTFQQAIHITRGLKVRYL